MRTLAAVALALLISPVLRADDTTDFLKPENWEGVMKYWKVTEKTIVGETMEDPKYNTFLCSKATYTDFELSFKVQLRDGIGNSGVQIRSKIVDDEKSKGKFIVGGPQCDLGAQYWGSLYGEKFGGMMKASDPEFVKKSVKPKEFNDYSIVSKGKKVTIKVNGETTVDQEFEKMPEKGIIAFQIHGGFPKMRVEYKDIVFKNTAAK